MDFKSLREIVASSDLVATHTDFVLSLAKPCVRITLSDRVTPGRSRFGGHPCVPGDFQWPTCDIGTYRFLGQIDFGEIINRPRTLPDSGLLSLFYAFSEDEDQFWHDDYIRGFYWSDLESFSDFKSPTEDVPAPQAIKLIGEMDIPRHWELLKNSPFDYKTWNRFTRLLETNDNYLLGYPSFTSLAYDPTPEGDWISLLTVHSLPQFDWCWHDGDKLMVFIEQKELRQQSFNQLKSDAG